MSGSRMLMQVFDGQLKEVDRCIGRSKLRFKDHIKQSMKMFNLSPGHIEHNSADRSQWRQDVHDGASHFENERSRARNERPRRRHAGPSHAPDTSDPVVWCPGCGRMCESLMRLPVIDASTRGRLPSYT